VDILNCMGLAMAVFAVAAAVDGKDRALWAALGALAVAAAAPLAANLDWGGTPSLIQEYLAPGHGRGRFAFFPNAAYLGFGLAAGTIVKRTAAERIERLMQWGVLTGLVLILAAQYFSNVPYSIYEKSNFWTDSPSLILIRTGIALLMLAGCYLWTEYGAGAGWSWMQALGKNSLMVYWVHVMLVYGNVSKPWKQSLGAGQAALAAAAVTALMVGLSEAWMRHKARQAERWKAAVAEATRAAAV
jgi:fucose 4-O-acetylase-like acetyltransferase